MLIKLVFVLCSKKQKKERKFSAILTLKIIEMKAIYGGK